MHTNSDTVTVTIVSECRPGPTLPTFPTQNVKLRVKLKAALKSSSLLDLLLVASTLER